MQYNDRRSADQFLVAIGLDLHGQRLRSKLTFMKAILKSSTDHIEQYTKLKPYNSVLQKYKLFVIMTSLDDVMTKKLIFQEIFFLEQSLSIFGCIYSLQQQLLLHKISKVKVKDQGHQKVRHQNQLNLYFYANFYTITSKLGQYVVYRQARI